MNDKRDQHERAAIDPQVAAQYELLADEAAPPELDRIVLRNASSAARTDSAQYPLMTWLRPAAFLATAGLSLALILDLSETGMVVPPDSILSEVQRPAVVVPTIATAPHAATGKKTAAETASALRREKSLATVASKMAAPVVIESVDGVGTATQAEGPGHCDDKQKADVAAWWQCVVSLRRAGMSDFAASELESLQREYPDFVVPE